MEKENRNIIWTFDLKTIIIAILLLACLIFIANQAITLVYKVQLLYSPCDLCVKLNPEWNECYSSIQKNENLINKNISFNFP